MFRNLASILEGVGGAREQVFLIHPIQLSRWADEAWDGIAAIPPLPIGSPPGPTPLLGSALLSAKRRMLAPVPTVVSTI